MTSHSDRLIPRGRSKVKRPPTWGHVEPIPGERTRFYVRSATRPNIVYLVSLFECPPFGRCNCPHWEFTIQPLIARGVFPSKSTFCKHIEAAWLYFRVFDLVPEIAAAEKAARLRARREAVYDDLSIPTGIQQ